MDEIFDHWWNLLFLKTFSAFPTCESFKPSFSASFLRSGLLMYFWIWKRFSSPCRWASEKTARRIMPRRGLPLAAAAHGNDVAKCSPSGWWWLDCVDRPFVNPFGQLTELVNDDAPWFDPINVNLRLFICQTHALLFKSRHRLTFFNFQLLLLLGLARQNRFIKRHHFLALAVLCGSDLANRKCYKVRSQKNQLRRWKRQEKSSIRCVLKCLFCQIKTNRRQRCL